MGSTAPVAGLSSCIPPGNVPPLAAQSASSFPWEGRTVPAGKARLLRQETPHPRGAAHVSASNDSGSFKGRWVGMEPVLADKPGHCRKRSLAMLFRERGR